MSCSYFPLLTLFLGVVLVLLTTQYVFLILPIVLVLLLHPNMITSLPLHFPIILFINNKNHHRLNKNHHRHRHLYSFNLYLSSDPQQPPTVHNVPVFPVRLPPPAHHHHGQINLAPLAASSLTHICRAGTTPK